MPGSPQKITWYGGELVNRAIKTGLSRVVAGLEAAKGQSRNRWAGADMAGICSETAINE